MVSGGTSGRFTIGFKVVAPIPGRGWAGNGIRRWGRGRMPVLQVNSIQLDAGRRRVEVAWRQEGAGPRSAVSTFAYQMGEQDAEKIRWYLEDYLEFPADPAPIVAADAETRLSALGSGLFRELFTSQDAAGIWAQAQ